MPSSWLPVLTNIEPPLEGGLEGRPPQPEPSWWRKQTTVAHDSWPIQHDILYHHHSDCHPGVNRGKILIQQTSQLSGGKTGIRPRWSTPTLWELTGGQLPLCGS